MHPLVWFFLVFGGILALLTGDLSVLFLAFVPWTMLPSPVSPPPADPDDPYPNRLRCPACGHTGIHIDMHYRAQRNPFIPGFGTHRRWIRYRCLSGPCGHTWGDWE